MNELEKLLDRSEELDWSYNIYDGYVELEKYSPLGEDFIITINFNQRNPDKSFLDNLREYIEDYDAEEHAAFWIDNRGKNGTPESIQDLLDDAVDIDGMMQELYNELSCE